MIPIRWGGIRDNVSICFFSKDRHEFVFKRLVWIANCSSFSHTQCFHTFSIGFKSGNWEGQVIYSYSLLSEAIFNNSDVRFIEFWLFCWNWNAVALLSIFQLYFNIQHVTYLKKLHCCMMCSITSRLITSYCVSRIGWKKIHVPEQAWIYNRRFTETRNWLYSPQLQTNTICWK